MILATVFLYVLLYHKENDGIHIDHVIISWRLKTPESNREIHYFYSIPNKKEKKKGSKVRWQRNQSRYWN